MKNISAGLLTDLNSSSITLVTCLKITATDGTVLGFTNYTRPVPFEGVLYSAAVGQTPTAVQSTSSLSVDNLDIETIRNIDKITGPDLLRGKWDFADVRLFILNPNNLVNGSLKLRRGRVGQVSLSRQKLTAEIRGMMDALTRQILEIYSPGCRVDLGSTRCQVKLDPPAWVASTVYITQNIFDANEGDTVKPITPNGRYFRVTVSGTSGGSEPSWNTSLGGLTVDGGVTWETLESLTESGTVLSLVSGKRRFTTTLLKLNDFYTGGLLTWTSGLNNGASMELKDYQNINGDVSLVLPMWFAITVGDAFSIHAGCFKRIIEDCKTKFGNSHNFQGEPYVQQNFEISPARVSQNAGGK